MVLTVVRSFLKIPLRAASGRGRPDVVAAFLLSSLTVFAAWGFLHGEPIVAMDTATQYYPWYSFLGEALRDGHIPGWNPHQFSGMPFVADPLSGWTYLPSMLLFALLPLVAAAKGYMLFHLLLAGLSVYALARTLGIGAPGAFFAAVAYEYSGFMYLQNTCCFPYVAVSSWLPLALLGVELAVRSTTWPGRLLWWGVSGLAVFQVVAAWLGQGAYYALLALAGYVAYRTVFSPPEGAPVASTGVAGRLLRGALHGGAVFALGLGLAAAGVLPRLEYNGLSNLAGGYPMVGGRGAESVGGWETSDWGLLLRPGHWYASVAVLSLALCAPLLVRKRLTVPRYAGFRLRVASYIAGVVRGRSPVPYFAALSLGALVLAKSEQTPLHKMLYLLPRLNQLHPHSPERVLVVFYLGVALLAGVSLTILKERASKKPTLLALPVLAGLSLLVTSSVSRPEIHDELERVGGWRALYTPFTEGGSLVPAGPLLALVLALALVGAYALIPARFVAWGGLAFALLSLVVFADLLGASKATIAEQRIATEGGIKMDLDEYYQPSNAARFIRSREDEEGPSRYLGFDPRHVKGGTISSPTLFDNPISHTLETNNRAMSGGLESIQGYNPVRIGRYDEYMRALNKGVDQGSHHFADVFDEDLRGPLLNLLNARYIIVPDKIPPENQPGLQRVLRAQYPTVYEDDRARVLENKEALPRVWIAHSARQVRTREEALDLLSVGEVDPKETVLLEDTPPEMSQPEDSSADNVSITEYGADDIELETSTGAPGMLVLSEVYYPAWRAYVDGQPVKVYPTDHLFRSVPVPAGEHKVELRYESQTLRTGIGITIATCAVFAALVLTSVALGLWRRRSGGKPAA